MANLRANNLTGTGGRNAIDGSVYFSNEAVDYLTVGANGLPSATDHFNFLHNGTSDFNAEFWIKPGKDNDRQTVFSTGGNSSTTGFACRIMEDGAAGGSNGYKVFVQFSRGSSGNWLGFLGGTLTVGEWAHVALTFTTSNKQLAIYVNGVLTNSSDLDGTANGTFGSGDFATGNSTYPMEIGREPYNTTMYLDGATVSNFRICQHVIYTAAFTPPTTKLELHNGTALLCCQDTNNPTQEASGKEMVGVGGLYYGKRYSNIATNGDLETGDTTGWTNGGCTTFEASTEVVHSGTYSLHCVSDGNGDYVYTTASVKSSLRYKVSAYINCVGPGNSSAKAKMKLDHSSAGASQLYESQTANNGAGWQYVEWMGLAQSSTMYITFNESSANNVNDWYVDDLRVELWYPEEDQNIIANPNFLTGATGWSFTNGNSPSSEWTIASNKLTVTDTSRTNDAIASQQLFSTATAEGNYRFQVDYSMSVGDFDVGVGGNRRFGIRQTYLGGAGDNASVTYTVDGGNSNVNLRILANQYGAGYFNAIQLFRIAEPKRINDLPPVGVDEGVTFEGDTKINSPGVMYFPTGDTSQRGRGTALFAGGYVTPAATADIEYLSIPSGGITTKWGNLSTTQLSAGQSLSSKTRQLIGGGWASPINNNTINYITIATSGNSLNFGDLVVGRRGSSSVSNDTRGIWGGGYISPADAGTPTMDYVTIATLGDAADFGDLSGNAKGGTATGSTTRAVFALGNVAPSDVNTLEYVTIATLSDYTNFGDLPSGSYGRYNGSCSSNTRGIFAGGHYPTSVNTINYITIASVGDATDFGDLFLARSFPSGTSNGIRGVFMGGSTNPARQDTIDSVIIATTGNAVNWGDMRIASQAQNGAASDSHGGLS